MRVCLCVWFPYYYVECDCVRDLYVILSMNKVPIQYDDSSIAYLFSISYLQNKFIEWSGTLLKKRPQWCFILRTSLSKGKLTFKGIKKTKWRIMELRFFCSVGHLTLMVIEEQITINFLALFYNIIPLFKVHQIIQFR